MLIIDQTKQIMVNVDNVVYIYIERKTSSIKAALTIPICEGGSNKIHLGTYQSADDCKKVLGELVKSYKLYSDVPNVFKMPLGGEVE